MCYKVFKELRINEVLWLELGIINAQSGLGKELDWKEFLIFEFFSLS